jgi:hypothetical protein
MREGGRPRFPPGPRDALLLGGTVLDLVAREHGERAVIELVRTLDPGGPEAALRRAFGGELVHIEGVWRSHLASLSSTG